MGRCQAGRGKEWYIKKIHDELEVDMVAYNEHRINLKHSQNRVG